ncbi:MBL fold metallo-hydrolase [Fodinicola acaciae]|uniref:MBL fold metallo-hydrolase n=1 Tax=Fodinicola acaciae TaxID=2681555 RepID=UPI0013CFD65C|nr:MBL fold metallo-hydrolase [Fodinicola acaciae]
MTDGVTQILAPNPGPMTLDGTNTYVLDGGVVIDPGPLDDGHLKAITALGPVSLIITTHHHFDHTEAVPRLAELTNAPVREPGAYEDGEEVVPGLTAIHTPGHTDDSYTFVWRDQAAFTGDTILGRGTTVVDKLGPYLSTLRVLRDLGPLEVLPGHGPTLPDLQAVAGDYLRHREERLQQVRDALAAGDTTAEQVVERVYAEVDRSVWPAATASVRAQLEYLRGLP